MVEKISAVRDELFKRSALYSTDACLVHQVCKAMTVTVKNVYAMAKLHELPIDFVPEEAKVRRSTHTSQSAH